MSLFSYTSQHTQGDDNWWFANFISFYSLPTQSLKKQRKKLNERERLPLYVINNNILHRPGKKVTKDDPEHKMLLYTRLDHLSILFILVILVSSQTASKQLEVFWISICLDIHLEMFKLTCRDLLRGCSFSFLITLPWKVPCEIIAMWKKPRFILAVWGDSGFNVKGCLYSLP